MKCPASRSWLWPLALLALCLAPGARATALEELVAAGHLRVESSLGTGGPAVPGQKVRLYLDVATDGWFAGGTRIELPEVPGLVALQSKAFAANSTVRREGRNWVQQRWTLDLYPTREGRFTTGPITLQVEVNTGEGVVSGALRAPAVTLEARLPPGIAPGAETGSWVASPAFSASQNLEPERTELAPGDAVTRTITLEAEEVLDKMLPEVAPGGSEGLRAYPRPPRLESRSNRGRSSARRVQAITYVARAPGTYQLPGYDFDWWDTGSGELRSVRLPPLTITVSAPRQGPLERAAAHWPLAAAVLALGLLAWAGWRWLPPGSLRGPLAAAARAALRA